MSDTFIELSKYLLVLIIGIYTLESFIVFKHDNIESKKGIYVRQTLCIFALHFVGFATIALQKKEVDYWFLYAFELILLFSCSIILQTLYPKINKLTINHMIMLLVIGSIILARLSFVKAKKQFIIVVISFIIAMFIPFFIHKLKVLKHFTWLYGAIGIFALGIVLIVGAVTNGSKLTYTIAGFTFQPSEFVKILFVFFLAGMLADQPGLKRVISTSIFSAIHVLILVLSKDLGSALIFFVVYVVMLFVSTQKLYYLILGILLGIVAAIIAYFLFSHVQVRVETWQNPWDDINGKGYQITQSLFAIGTGGWFGLGLLGGTPKSIPLVEVDYVFSAIAEEMGVLFSLCVILICLSCFIMFMNIAMKLQDPFYRLIAVGLATVYGFQVFLTIGGGIKFIPLTGVTLPFISYGGSSILSTMIIFAIIQGLYIIRKEQDKSEKRKKRRTNSKYREEQND